jgi:chemotaxis protein methyltransferase CheR
MFPSPLELTNREFEKISRLVYDQCGIRLSQGKRELVKARLGKRIRSGPFRSFQDYYEHVVRDRSGEELVQLLNSISTNYTFFFREQAHYDYLRGEVLPPLIGSKRERAGRLRLWSAGCSSGEEAYSLAIMLLEAIENPSAWDLMILATDLSTKVLDIASPGVYPKERVQSVPPGLVKKYFLQGVDGWANHVRVKRAVRRLVRFERLNLMEPFTFKEPFHCIFCRNVMIYFDKNTQSDLVGRFYDHVEPGGYLFIGHSESLTGIPHSFHYVRPSVYRK